MDDIDAFELGTGYALAGTLLDSQTDRVVDALAGLEQPYLGPQQTKIQVEITEPEIEAHNSRLGAEPPEWRGYVGQPKVKRQMRVRATAAKMNKTRMPHTLIASKRPGCGKTHLARLCARLMGVQFYELVPPFNIQTIVDAALTLNDNDVLFIDEVHKLSDNGMKGAEILLKILEEDWAPIRGQIVHLPKVTYVAATTERGRLPQTVIDRFKFKPHLEEYSRAELAEIAITFAARHDALDVVSNEMAMAIADACRSTPRITEEMVMACKDLADVYGSSPEPWEMLEFTDTEPDGMTPLHINYITALRSLFPRQTKHGLEYMSGAPSLTGVVKVDEDEMLVLETFLLERGYIDKTPQGRRLQAAGIVKAEEYLAEGRGVTSA